MNTLRKDMNLHTLQKVNSGTMKADKEPSYSFETCWKGLCELGYMSCCNKKYTFKGKMPPKLPSSFHYHI